MTYFLLPQQSRYFLSLAIGMIACLLLLINTSFKIVELHGVLFSISSLLCPVIAGLYLLVLRNCTYTEQRHILNFCLMALYAFSIGVYLLVNLPAAEYMHNNPAYPIVFEDIPKKFFAATLAFVLSIYFPHWFFNVKKKQTLLPTQSKFISQPPTACPPNPETQQRIPWFSETTMSLAMFGGFAFFGIHFLLR